MNSDHQAMAETAVSMHGHLQPFQFAENIIYLMGLSFIVGSLFTIFILILLDFMRRNADK